MAENAAKAGVESICCVPPFFYHQSDEAIVEHYRAVGAAANLPLFVYNLPQSTGVEITPELMQKIQDGVPQLKGLKHSALTFANVRAFNKMGLSCLIGNGFLMLPALTIGATGCVDGPPNVAPELWVEIWNAYTIMPEICLGLRLRRTKPAKSPPSSGGSDSTPPPKQS